MRQILKAISCLLFILASTSGTIARSSSEMSFVLDNQKRVILAKGAITQRSADAFREFLIRQQTLGTPWDIQLHLTSEGGNLNASLKMGRLIRAHQITVVVNEVCASACVFTLMGGVRRYFLPGTKIGVHQFYSDRVLDNLDKKEFTGVEQIAQQITMGAVLEYASEMGIDSALIALASKTLPVDLRYLTEDEAITYRLAKRLEEASIQKQENEGPRPENKLALSGLQIGDPISKLESIGLKPTHSERMGPHRIVKYKFADQNELSVTINVNTNSIVYLESDWGRSSAGSVTDIDGLRFGRTTLKDISDLYGSFGFHFRERGIIRKYDTGFLVFNSYDKNNIILSFITRISFNEASSAIGGRVALIAKLEAIVISDPSYIEGIWGPRGGAIDAELEGLVPNQNTATPARKPKSTEIDRFVAYNNFAVAASNSFDKTYKEGGMIKVRTAIEECYLRAHKIKTERSAAYCFMFDYLASLLSEAAASRLGFPVDQFHTKSMMLSRNDQLMRVMKYPPDKRIEVIAEWSKLATDNLLKASSPNPNRSAR